MVTAKYITLHSPLHYCLPYQPPLCLAARVVSGAQMWVACHVVIHPALREAYENARVLACVLQRFIGRQQLGTEDESKMQSKLVTFFCYFYWKKKYFLVPLSMNTPFLLYFTAYTYNNICNYRNYLKQVFQSEIKILLTMLLLKIMCFT